LASFSASSFDRVIPLPGTEPLNPIKTCWTVMWLASPFSKIVGVNLPTFTGWTVSPGALAVAASFFTVLFAEVGSAHPADRDNMQTANATE